MAPDYELIVAVIARLKADATVAGLVVGRIYDRVPETTDGKPNAASPYISIGPSSSIPADFDCMDGQEVTIQIDAWSWGSGEAYSSAQVRKLADAVRRSLHDAEFGLTANALVTIQHELTRIMRDPDGVTNHAAIQFTATIETP